MQIQRCLSDQDLREFDAGALPGARYEAVAEHLESCRDCAARYERLETLPDRMLDQLRMQLPQEALTDDSELDLLVSRAAALQQTSENGGNTVVDRNRQRQDRLAEWIPQLLVPPQAPDELGRLGGYRVLRVLGMGGMGVVFEAEDPALKRLVALKVMNPDSASDASRARFLREAQAMAAVHHDNVVKVYQVGEDRGTPFLAMELLEGQSLADRLSTHKRLPVSEALRVARETALGLAAAHAKGLTHRDIKPDNIWLEEQTPGRLPSGPTQASQPTTHGPFRVKILDFGLAHAADLEQNLTQSGTVVGTPNYLSPEQAEGKSIDARTDQFSLGIVLYEMLSGEKPFARPTLLATLRSIGSDAPRELDDTVPADVAALVRRMLEKRPEHRYATCEELIAAIESCQQSATLNRPVARKFKTGRGLMIAATSLVLMLGVMITVRDKNGNIIARLFAPGGSKVDVESSDANGPAIVERAKNSARESITPTAKLEVADHLPPLSPAALVQRPPKLNAKAGEEVVSWTILPAGTAQRSAFALSLDGKWLATHGNDGAVRVWDVEKKSLHQALIGHMAGPCSPAVKPNDRSNWGYAQSNSRRFGPLAWRPQTNAGLLWLASASRDGSVRVWDATKGTTVWIDSRDIDTINMLAWSPDGTKLAVGYDDGQVRTWEADGWKELQSLSFAEGPPFSLGWSPNSQLLAVHSSPGVQAREGVVLVWDFVTGKPQRLDSTGIQNGGGQNHLHGHSAMRWSPDGKQLAVRVNEGLAIYETTNWKPTHRLTSGLKDHIQAQDVDWSPDASSVLVSWSGKLQLHDLQANKVTPVPLQDNRLAQKVEWAPGSTQVALWNVDAAHGYLALLDTQTMKIRSLQDGNAMLHEFSADGTRLLYNNANSPRILRLEADNAAGWQPPNQPALGASHSAATWSPDGARAMVLGKVWNVAGPHFDEWNLEQKHFVSWMPNSQGIVAYHGVEDQYELLSIPERRRLVTLELPGIPKPQAQMVWAISYSPDGSQIAIGGHTLFNGELFILNGSSGKLMRRLKIADRSQDPHSTRAACWSHQGDRLAVVRDSYRDDQPPRYRLIVVDPKDGKTLWPKAQWPQEAHRPDSLIWSPEDRWLLCVTPGVVEVYDGADGKHQASYKLPATSRAIHFLDKDTALCGTRDGFVHRLDLASGKHEVLTKGLGNVVEISPDGQQLAVDRGSLSIHRLDGGLQASFLSLGNYEPFIIGADGHFLSNDQSQGPFWATKGSIPQMLVYVVQTASGRQTLTPVEFATRYGWQNDPAKIGLK